MPASAPTCARYRTASSLYPVLCQRTPSLYFLRACETGYAMRRWFHHVKIIFSHAWYAPLSDRPALNHPQNRLSLFHSLSPCRTITILYIPDPPLVSQVNLVWLREKRLSKLSFNSFPPNRLCLDIAAMNEKVRMLLVIKQSKTSFVFVLRQKYERLPYDSVINEFISTLDENSHIGTPRAGTYIVSRKIHPTSSFVISIIPWHNEKTVIQPGEISRWCASLYVFYQFSKSFELPPNPPAFMITVKKKNSHVNIAKIVKRCVSCHLFESM